HFLPIAQHSERFEELFATPHGLDLEGAARLCGAEFVRVTDGRTLRSALQRPASGLRIVEARTDRAANVSHHRVLQSAVIGALGDPPWRRWCCTASRAARGASRGFSPM